MGLYDTKIKDFLFKFYVDNKKAQFVDIEHRVRKKNAYFIQTKIRRGICKDLVYENYVF
jgi:hypothetical protein